MSTTRFGGDVTVAGRLTVGGGLVGLARSDLAIEALTAYPLDPLNWRVHDAVQTVVPGTSSADDFGLIGGTFGTATPTLQTQDLKAAGATSKYARRLLRLPPEYVAGQSVRLAITAGMVTTVADTAATIDVSVYRDDGAGGVDGGDRVQTAAQSVNSLTAATKTFVLDAAGLAAGDLLDVRLHGVVTDAATATAVKLAVYRVDLLLDIRG